MTKFATKHVVVFAGLLAAPAVTGLEPKQTPVFHQDPRIPALKAFFEKYDCPVSDLAREFLMAADKNDLDWRLLPSISLIESGGGKAMANNNLLGWGSSSLSFPSVRVAIQTVASRLANSKLYKDKDLDGILYTYNPRPEYSYKVKAVMSKLGSASLGNEAWN
jgi:hypothetical protein